MNEVQPIKNKRDIERMKRALRGSSRDLLLFIVGINTALRISDILELRVGDISGEYITLKERKTGKMKRIKINDAIQKAFHDLVPSNAKPTEYLFPSRKGNNPIGRVQAWRILNTAAERAGINIDIGSHTMRKTAGYFFYKETNDIALVMRLLNHSSAKETLRYIGVTQEKIDDTYMSLNL